VIFLGDVFEDTANEEAVDEKEDDVNKDFLSFSLSLLRMGGGKRPIKGSRCRCSSRNSAAIKSHSFTMACRLVVM
jgi:hypothetical protein